MHKIGDGGVWGTKEGGNNLRRAGFGKPSGNESVGVTQADETTNELGDELVA